MKPNSTPFPSHWLNQQINVVVVGAGGNGSQIMHGLARLHRAMLSLGHPKGLEVTLCDPDIVTEANIGRQLFSASDIGLNKAVVTVHRLNMFHGLQWDAEPRTLRAMMGRHGRADIVIGCVDTLAARREILATKAGNYWLDLGNTATTGQVVLGNLNYWSVAPKGSDWGGKDKAKSLNPGNLPHFFELYPNLFKAKQEPNTPSCSLAEALGKQDLFINQAVATSALQLLWTWYRHGSISHNGSFINLETGVTRPLPIDPEAWKRIRGPKPSKRAKRRKSNLKRHE